MTLLNRAGTGWSVEINYVPSKEARSACEMLALLVDGTHGSGIHVFENQKATIKLVVDEPVNYAELAEDLILTGERIGAAELEH